jgi:ubiquinone/menaquinone biosynthesis C-methylase UbiE
VSRVLDFGAGVGGSVPHFRRHLPQARLTCIDVSEKSLDIAAARFPGEAEFVGFDGSIIPFQDASFDVAFAACVFHHIPEPKHVPLLAELLRVLKQGGRLFVFEHNPFNPLTVHAVNTCAFDENAVLIRASGLRKRVRAAGFSRADVRFHVFFPGALRALRPMERWLEWCPAGAQYSVAGRK